MTFNITVVVAFVGRGGRWHFGPAVKGMVAKKFENPDLNKLLKDGLCSIDKCYLLNKDKVRCVYFGLIPKLSWPMQIYEVSITKVETMEQFNQKKELINVILYSLSTKLKFLTLSLVEAYKLGKARLFQMSHAFRPNNQSRISTESYAFRPNNQSRISTESYAFRPNNRCILRVPCLSGHRNDST